MHPYSPRHPHLDAVQSFLSTVPTDASGRTPPMLHPVEDAGARLHASEHRITVFGAVKTGKSSIVNTLLHAPLLLVHSHRTVSTVTEVQYGERPAATVTRRGGRAEEVPFDDVRALQSTLDGSGGLDRVSLSVPLPLLTGKVFVDTPGLLHTDAVSEIAYGELFRADLAVVVLAADKILSAREREFAAWVHEVLQGNVIFLVNRMDLVEEEEREEVVQWARSALRDTGNDLVGRATIFAASALPGSPLVPDRFEAWLRERLNSDLGPRLSLVSRLGILRFRLQEAMVEVRREREQAEKSAREARELYLERVMTERAAAQRAIAESRVRLRAVRERLPALDDAFTSGIREAARADLHEGHRDSTLHDRFQSAFDRYARSVQEDVASALAGTPVAPPPARFSGWILRELLDPVRDPARDLGVTLGDALTRIVDGGRTGREAGAVIGGWIGKNVLGVDAERETLRHVDTVARGALASLRREAESYLSQVATRLDEAGSSPGTAVDSAPHMEEWERQERFWTSTAQWCEGFLRTVRLATEEVLSAPGDEGI
jgi:hypothetical protein